MNQVHPSPAAGEVDGRESASPAGPAYAGFRTITLFDTAVASNNLGDSIIMEAVRQELAELFANPLVFAFTVATHQGTRAGHRRVMHRSDYAIVGGTNLLSSRMWFRPMWKVTPADAMAGLNVVLMGVGWYQYQHAPDPYTKWLYRRLLSRTHLHSVRESYALERLAGIGITNVVNTGCPTIWALSPAGCARLPKTKADAVVTAINSYPKLNKPVADRRMFEILRKHYKTVYLWIQTNSDYEYARSLDGDLRFIDPTLSALDAVLTSALDIDYVGVRLRAGIRAIQKGRRAIILEIDNRAREMGRDFGLPTVARTDFDRLERMIAGPLEISVTPPRDAIERWKSQFRADA